MWRLSHTLTHTHTHTHTRIQIYTELGDLTQTGVDWNLRDNTW